MLLASAPVSCGRRPPAASAVAARHGRVCVSWATACQTKAGGVQTCNWVFPTGGRQLWGRRMQWASRAAQGAAISPRVAGGVWCGVGGVGVGCWGWGWGKESKGLTFLSAGPAACASALHKPPVPRHVATATHPSAW